MDITLERILSLIPSEKDGRFKKYAAADFASKIGVAPYVGYIRYQRQMAAYTGETASVVLCVVLSKIMACTHV